MTVRRDLTSRNVTALEVACASGDTVPACGSGAVGACSGWIVRAILIGCFMKSTDLEFVDLSCSCITQLKSYSACDCASSGKIIELHISVRFLSCHC